MLRRHQHIEQGHHVQHFAAVNELGFFANLGGDVQLAQLGLQGHQPGPFARQHHHVSGFQLGVVKVLRDPVRGLAGLQRAQGFFGDFTRRGQAVAPFAGRIRRPRGPSRPQDDGQLADSARQIRTGGVVTKAFVRIRLRRIAHRRVDAGNHAGGVAPGVVAAEQVTAQRVMDEGFGGLEHLRFGAAKAVNTLLRVAHNKNAGRRGALATARSPTGPGVAAEPGAQGLPLQGVGVLKFVNQQVFDACVQPLLHPAGQHVVAQHDQRGALNVVHIDPAVLAFQGREFFQQQAGEPRHALLVGPGGVLQAGGDHAQHQLLRLAHQRDAADFFAKFARRAFAGQQGVKGGADVAFGKRHFQLNAFGGKGFGTGATQRFGGRQQGLPALRLGD